MSAHTLILLSIKWQMEEPTHHVIESDGAGTVPGRPFTMVCLSACRGCTQP